MLASSQSRLSSSWDSTHHGFQTETGSGLGSLETGDNRHPPHSLTTRDSLVPGPCPVCYLPLPLLPSRELEIMSNMESILSVGQGATRALGAGRGRRLGAGDTPRGLTFWARTWDEGAVARMGRLQRPGVGFFFFFLSSSLQRLLPPPLPLAPMPPPPPLLPLPPSSNVGRVRGACGQKEIIEPVPPLVEDFCHLPYQ